MLQLFNQSRPLRLSWRANKPNRWLWRGLAPFPAVALFPPGCFSTHLTPPPRESSSSSYDSSYAPALSDKVLFAYERQDPLRLCELIFQMNFQKIYSDLSDDHFSYLFGSLRAFLNNSDIADRFIRDVNVVAVISQLLKISADAYLYLSAETYLKAILVLAENGVDDDVLEDVFTLAQNSGMKLYRDHAMTYNIIAAIYRCEPDSDVEDRFHQFCEEFPKLKEVTMSKIILAYGRLKNEYNVQRWTDLLFGLSKMENFSISARTYGSVITTYNNINKFDKAIETYHQFVSTGLNHTKASLGPSICTLVLSGNASAALKLVDESNTKKLDADYLYFYHALMAMSRAPYTPEGVLAIMADLLIFDKARGKSDRAIEYFAPALAKALNMTYSQLISYSTTYFQNSSFKLSQMDLVNLLLRSFALRGDLASVVMILKNHTKVSFKDSVLLVIMLTPLNAVGVRGMRFRNGVVPDGYDQVAVDKAAQISLALFRKLEGQVLAARLMDEKLRRRSKEMMWIGTTLLERFAERGASCTKELVMLFKELDIVLQSNIFDLLEVHLGRGNELEEFLKTCGLEVEMGVESWGLMRKASQGFTFPLKLSK
ncbi:hypothetical protein HK096_004405 [Nowakowskiella sp. JEL0078]|nr:hypothetical protein HK096_004405 [Nowakowskiella sp. JEL0078]